MQLKQSTKRVKRKLRVRKKIIGTATMPRLSVFRSNQYTYGQLIDDSKGETVVSLSLDEVKAIHKGKVKTEAAKEVGKKLAETALKNKIDTVVFDRNSYKYHGRVRMLAEGAREGGLNF